MKNHTGTLADLIKKDIKTANSLIENIKYVVKIQKNTDKLLEKLIQGNRNTSETYKLFNVRLPSNESTVLASKMKICLECLMKNIGIDLFNIHLPYEQQQDLSKSIKIMEERSKEVLK